MDWILTQSRAGLPVACLLKASVNASLLAIKSTLKHCRSLKGMDGRFWKTTEGKKSALKTWNGRQADYLAHVILWERCLISRTKKYLLLVCALLDQQNFQPVVVFGLLSVSTKSSKGSHSRTISLSEQAVEVQFVRTCDVSLWERERETFWMEYKS